MRKQGCPMCLVGFASRDPSQGGPIKAVICPLAFALSSGSLGKEAEFQGLHLQRKRGACNRYLLFCANSTWNTFCGFVLECYSCTASIPPTLWHFIEPHLAVSVGARHKFWGRLPCHAWGKFDLAISAGNSSSYLALIKCWLSVFQLV